MFPLLNAGDEVLLDARAYRKEGPQVGDVVVLRHPEKAGLKMVKRVTAVRADGWCFVMGDNVAASHDSRVFGYVSPEQIIGRVVCRFP